MINPGLMRARAAKGGKVSPALRGQDAQGPSLQDEVGSGQTAFQVSRRHVHRPKDTRG